MLYAFIGYPPVTRRTMMHLETVARPVLVAHSAFVAVNGEPGLALGRPFGRPHVTFIVAASHWSSMMIGVPYPAHAQPNPADLTLTSRNLPYRTQPRLTPTKHTRGHLATAHQSLPGHIALACALAGGMPYHNQPNRTRPKRNEPDPTEGDTTQPKRTLAYLSAGYLSIPRLTWPHRILTHTHCAIAGVFPSTAKRSEANTSGVYTSSAKLTGSCHSASKPTGPHRTASACALAGDVLSRPHRSPPHRTIPSLIATHQGTPQHTVSCRKRKNPNTCALVGLLRTHGGCTDVRVVDHEPQQNSPRDVSPKHIQYIKSGRPCQEGVASERA